MQSCAGLAQPREQPGLGELRVGRREFGEAWEFNHQEVFYGGKGDKVIEDAPGRYIEFVKHTFPRGLSLEGLRVVVDCANGAAYKVAPRWLLDLGGDVVPIGVEHSKAIAAGLGDARTVVVGPAAHLANVEQPTAVTQHILGHLGTGGAT